MFRISANTLPIMCLFLNWKFIQITATNWRPLKFPNSNLSVPGTYEVFLTEDKPTEYISSPGFPYEYYPNDIQLFYTIQVKLKDAAKQLSTRILIFFDMFALEESDYCYKDGLEFVDKSKQMRAFCGVRVGQTILSESNTIHIRFFTDSEVQSRGYSIRLDMYNTGCSSTVNLVDTWQFSSPNYPGRYYSDDVCVWKIVAPEGKNIRAQFDKVFDIRGYIPYCTQDYLAVSRNGDFAKDIKRLCYTTQPEEIDSNGNTMLFLFRTDCCFEGKGFRVTVKVIDPSDVITTPQPPLPPTECSCGIENVKLNRIVGGEVVNPPNRYPWVVPLISSRRNSVICGGALINTLYILTACHCLERETPSTLKVLLGSENIKSSADLVPVVEFIFYPSYDNRTYNNDICLLKLQNPATMTDKVRPLCLPPKNLNTKDDRAIIAGWGYDIGGILDDDLKAVELTVVSNPSCVEKLGNIITDRSLCAGGEEDKDSCQGDSGGPLFVKKGDRFYGIGIASWGIGCGREGYPGVYTRISEYIDWIQENVKDAPPCDSVSPPIEPNIEDCGITNTKAVERIVGGTETQPFEYPWIALIVYNRTVEGVGALISCKYVMTAASVFDSWMEWYPEILDVFLGEHALDKKEPFTKRYQVESVIHHSQYGRPSPYNNDLALLKLKVSTGCVEKWYRPICLPRSTTWYPAKSCLITAGWGRTSTYGPGSNTLMEISLDVVSQKDCASTYPNWVTDRMICAYSKGKDTCKGDSGAPLMRFYNGRYYLAGVSSWASKEGCAIDGKPRVFSAIHKNLRWISENTGLAVA